MTRVCVGYFDCAWGAEDMSCSTAGDGGASSGDDDDGDGGGEDVGAGAGEDACGLLPSSSLL